MVRATYARCLVRLGGALPDTFWTEGKVTSLCTQADYIIDGYTNPNIISTTSNMAIEVAVDVVLRMMRQADMLRRSSGTSQAEGMVYPDHKPLSDEIKQRIDKILNVGYFAVTTINLMEE